MQTPVFDPTRCQHPRQEIRRRAVAGGHYQFRLQCLDCGHAVGGAIGRAKIPEPWINFDEALHKRHWGANALAERKASAELRDPLREQWRERYQNHIGSARWRTIADRVLNRDNFICKGCGETTATQVHHLTYAHIGEEFLFELISLCRSCHTRLHPNGQP